MSDYPSVLYVEDDPLSRMVLEILLTEKMGLTDVTIFPDSQDFIQKVAALPHTPDIFVLDIHMNPISGFQMLTLLREHPAYSKKIVTALTASVMNEEVEKLRIAGFDGVLAKPINEDMFPSIFQRLLSGEQIWTVL